MNLQIRQTTGPQLKSRIRLNDPTSDTIMKECLKCSPMVWESSIDGEGACIWGMIPPSLMSDRAYIWLYTTEVADKHSFVLVRQSKLMIDEMLKECPELYGYCRNEDLRAIRWLKWLGAEFGLHDEYKIQFRIRKK